MDGQLTIYDVCRGPGLGLLATLVGVYTIYLLSPFNDLYFIIIYNHVLVFAFKRREQVPFHQNLFISLASHDSHYIILTFTINLREKV